MPLDALKQQIEKELKKAIEELGEANRLREACAYALLSGGKRLRPLLVLMIGQALGNRLNVMPAALSVEYFHTASLIADDLPCMDNDEMRRNRPTLHKVYGESIAVLASYTLIAAGYGGLHQNCEAMKQVPLFASQANQAALLCLESATRCAGLKGATNGQFLDLYPPDLTLQTLEKIIFQKTGTLFEISFVFGWLFGGGQVQDLEQIRSCAHHLGMAFQIADDLQDDLQDEAHASGVNLARLFGREKAEGLFQKEMKGFEEGLKRLGLWTQEFEELCAGLWHLVPFKENFQRAR